MKVLITGAAGVVGRAVTAALETNHELILLDKKPAASDKHQFLQADIDDWQGLRQTIASCGPIEAVVHLVYSPDKKTLPAEQNSANQFDISVKGTWNLLQEAKRLGAKKCVYASTMGVYGSLQDGPYSDETEPWKFADIGSYGVCKLLGEYVVRYFAYSQNMPGVSLRLYGVHESGLMERRGTHVEDVGRAFLLALETDLGIYEAINLAPGIPGIDISNEKAERLLGWRPEHIFEKRPELEDWSAPED